MEEPLLFSRGGEVLSQALPTAKGSRAALQGEGGRASTECEHSSPCLCPRVRWHQRPQAPFLTELGDLLRIELWRQEMEKEGEEKAKRMLQIESSQGRSPRGCSDSRRSSSHATGGWGGAWGGEHSRNPGFKSGFGHLVDEDAAQVTPCLGASRSSSVYGGNNACVSGPR